MSEEKVFLPDGGHIDRPTHERYLGHVAEAERRNTLPKEGNEHYEPTDIAHEEASVLDARMDELNSGYEEPSRELEGYNDTAKEFLLQLTDEEFEVLKHTYFYHVTNRESIDAIMENGLGGDRLTRFKEEFEFLDEMYQKYRNDRDPKLYYLWVQGQGEQGDSRFSSEEAQISAYQIPERIKFLLQNLCQMLNGDYLSESERAQAEEIYQNHLVTLKDAKDYVYTIGLSVITPSILNATSGELTAALNSGFSKTDLLRIMASGDGDMSFGSVPPQALKVLGIYDINNEYLEDAINGGTGIYLR